MRLKMTVRLAGINAPEMATPEGPVSKAWLSDQIGGQALVIRTIKDRREKYGRYLGHIWTAADGTFTERDFATSEPSLNERMIAAGQAVPY